MAKRVAIMNRKGYRIDFRARVMNAGGTSAIYISPWNTEILRDDKLALVWELESGEYFYRPKLNGKIKFVGELARVIMEDMDKNSYVELALYEHYAEYDTPYESYMFDKTLKFRVRKSDCKVSARGKIYPGTNGQAFKYYYILDVSPTPMDWYEKVVDNWDKEYDLIKLRVPRSNLDYIRRPCLQLFCPNNDYIGNFLGGNYWETQISDSSTALATNKRFSVVAVIRSIRIESTLPASYGLDMTGMYWLDQVNFTPSPSAYDYYMYLNNDATTGKALHISLWGGQNNQTTEIKYSENIGTTANPMWYDYFTIVEGKSPTSGGYDYFTFPGGGLNWSSGNYSYNYATASTHVKATIRVKTYYARWFLPTSTFVRQTYARPTDDITEVSGLSDYKYLANAIPPDVEIQVGYQNDTPNIYGQNDDGEYFNPPGPEYCPLLQTSWDYLGIWLNRESFNSDGVESTGREYITIPDGYRIQDVLRYLFLATIYEGNVENHLSEINIIEPYLPTGEIFERYYNQLSSLMITPKSNITRGRYSLSAQKAPITLRSVLDLLKQTRKLYWYRDPDGNISFNNEEYFINTLPSKEGFYLDIGDYPDSTAKNPRNNRSLAWGNEDIEFNKDDIPEREKFGWMDPSTDPFNGPIVLNKGNLVKPDQEDESKVADFTSDVDYMIISPSECSLDGFAFVFNGIPTASPIQYPEMAVPYKITKVVYLGSTYTLGNGLLSFTALFEGYLNKRRPTEEYKYLYADTTYTAANLIKSVTQNVVIPIPLIWKPTTFTANVKAIPIASDSELWYGRVLTKFGSGLMTKISINIASRIASVTLALEP